MKITIKIEGAPEGFKAHGVARDLAERSGWCFESLKSITFNDKGAVIVGEARLGDGAAIDF